MSIEFSLYLINLFFLLALLTISVRYTKIWLKVRFGISKPTTRLQRYPWPYLLSSVYLSLPGCHFFIVGVVLDFCRHYCFSWRIFYLTKLFHFGNSAVNPLVYGFRIPKYRMLFLKFLDIKYAPGHDSIEFDNRALRNSPANVGIFSNVSVDINFRNKQTPPCQQVSCVRCSSLLVITMHQRG